MNTVLSSLPPPSRVHYIDIILSSVVFRERLIPLMICSAPGFQSDRCVFIAHPYEKAYGDMKWGFIDSASMTHSFTHSLINTLLLFKLYKTKVLKKHCFVGGLPSGTLGYNNPVCHFKNAAVSQLSTTELWQHQRKKKLCLLTPNSMCLFNPSNSSHVNHIRCM